jgi:glucosamine--fructose-6-phosphate aminotransferase (isomerizing)
MTIARGSSDHAANYGKYILETQLGLATVSAAPSIITLYDSPLKLDKALVIGISQSGQSYDICETMRYAKKQGAVTIALVNAIDSPLANIAEFVLPLHAGEELAVAATKSYIASLTALLHLVSYYSKNKNLQDVHEQLPHFLEAALLCDWQLFIDTYQNIHSTIITGRGFSLPIALESALKCKETSGIHAEAFSSAEILHGPFALMKAEYPVLLFGQNDRTLEDNLALAKRIRELAGKALLALPSDVCKEEKDVLPLPKSLHPLCDPIVGIQAFYPSIAKLSVLKGFNPDKPKHLNKVTSTR